MIASARARRASLALAAAVFTAALALAALTARAEETPVPGGTVPSVLGLSLSEPSGFRRHGSVYTSVVRAEVTSTDTPAQLSVADGEVTAGPRLGHLVRGASILSPALRARADGGPYRSLDAALTAPLMRWSEPVARAATKIRLRQVAPDARALHGYHKLLLITLTVAGP